MKRTWPAAAAVILTLAIACSSFAYETDFDDLKRFDRSLPAWKLGRGIVNMFSGPYEIISNMTNEAINGAYIGAYDGALQGYLAGVGNGIITGAVTGLYLGVQRTTVGAMEALTFWKPEFGPTIEPLYGTRERVYDAPGDYYSPDPWWYNGPQRW